MRKDDPVSASEKVEFVTLAAQDPKMLANALSIAIKRVYGEIPEWYAANRLSRTTWPYQAKSCFHGDDGEEGCPGRRG